MGLDIYFYKVKNFENRTPNQDWEKVYEKLEEQSRELLEKTYDSAVRSLKKAKDDKVYYRVIKRLCKLSNYPQFDFKKLGVDYDYTTGKFSYNPVPLSVFEQEKTAILDRCGGKYHAYFRKANFVYRFFQHKLYEEKAWVEKEDLTNLIDRCEKVLKDNSLAEELLPTQSGFFFGSTCYDEWYYYDVKDCLKQMKKLLKGLKDDESIFVSMSW